MILNADEVNAIINEWW